MLTSIGNNKLSAISPEARKWKTSRRQTETTQTFLRKKLIFFSSVKLQISGNKMIQNTSTESD